MVAVSIWLALALASRGAVAPAPPPATSACSPLVPTTWRVVRRIARAGDCFTQGLFFRGRELVESCGLCGASRVRTVSLANGSFVETARAANNASDFGEGAAQWPPADAPNASGALLQLTWRERAVIVWDARALRPLARVPFATPSGEGWGLTSDGESELIASDGSQNLFAWAPDAAAAGFRPLRPPLPARDAIAHADGWAPPGPAPSGSGWAPRALVRPRGVSNGSAVVFLNELEFAHGWVLANIWYDARVAVIHPASGAVVWYLDFAPLLAENAGADVTNGLAYTMHLDIVGGGGGAPDGSRRRAQDVALWGGRLWATGKFWPHIYELELGGLVDASLLASPAPPRCADISASPSPSGPPAPTATPAPTPSASPTPSPAGTSTTEPSASPAAGSGSGGGAPGHERLAALASAAAATSLAAAGWVVWRRRAVARAAQRFAANNTDLAEPFVADIN
jgi:glutamine cyclotransferase